MPGVSSPQAPKPVETSFNQKPISPSTAGVVFQEWQNLFQRIKKQGHQYSDKFDQAETQPL
jgi:hypothetical protein